MIVLWVSYTQSIVDDAVWCICSNHPGLALWIKRLQVKVFLMQFAAFPKQISDFDGSLISVKHLILLHVLFHSSSDTHSHPVKTSRVTQFTTNRYVVVLYIRYVAGNRWYLYYMRARALNSFWRMYVPNTTISIKLERCVTVGRCEAISWMKLPPPKPGRTAVAWADRWRCRDWRDLPPGSF